MNRPFWSFRSSPQNICDGIEPLLSVYADDAASPAETRQVDAHLPECKACRAALSWMQATRAVLASRPVAVPPPDLHSRIALAIAASTPVPVSLRPARVFTVRTAYAAAASVTALGIALSYSLWHTPADVAVKHSEKPTAVAIVPVRAVKPHLAPKTATRPLVASNRVKPAVAKHSVLARKIVPVAVTPLEHTASNVVLPKLPVVSSIGVKAPVHHAPLTQKIASRDIAPTEKHNTEKHAPLPAVKTALPKLLEGPKVAKIIKVPIHVPVDIQPTKVTSDPIVRTASTRQVPSSASSDPLGFYKAQLKENESKFHSISFASVTVPVSRTAQEAMSLPHVLGGNDHTAFISAVHGNQ